MIRNVVRSWNRRGAEVATVHSRDGELVRGRIEARHEGDPQARGTWHLRDQDAIELGIVHGDYLDAEARLFELTAWADEDTEPAAPRYELTGPDNPDDVYAAIRDLYGPETDEELLARLDREAEQDLQRLAQGGMTLADVVRDEALATFEEAWRDELAVRRYHQEIQQARDAAARAAVAQSCERVRQHPPASERTIRAALADWPGWLIEQCLSWTREREAHGHQFTDGTAAVRHWRDQHGMC